MVTKPSIQKERRIPSPMCESVHSPNIGDGECEWHEGKIQDENFPFVDNDDEQYNMREAKATIC